LLVAVERALGVLVQRVDLLRRGTVSAAHGSVGVLSKRAYVPRGDATIEQPTEGGGHASRILLEDGPHPVRSTEVRRVARIEEVRIERRAPALALLLEHVAQVVWQRLYVGRWDTR